ncbi:MAG: hypothetical protein R3250_11880 [Melioribacteraceae bacterium]|nr:hypothetical protein [Melioribacteraceae bacterium]
MSLKSQIEALASTLYPDYTFIFASRLNADATVHDISEDDTPIIKLDNRIPKDKRINLNSNITSTNNIELYALRRRNDDDSDETINGYIEEMELVCDRFAINIQALDNVLLSENEELQYRTQPIFMHYISGLCGSKLIMRAKEQQVISCTP